MPHPPFERKFITDFAVPPPDSPAAIMAFIRLLLSSKSGRKIKTVVSVELGNIVGNYTNKRARQAARLRRLHVLGIYLRQDLVEGKIYGASLKLLRFHPDTYLPSAQNEINEFAALLSLAKTASAARKIAVQELNHLYTLIMGTGRSRKPEVPKDPLERAQYLRRLATVKTLLSLRRSALRSLLGEEIALPTSPSPYVKGYLALSLDRSEYQQLRHHTEEVVDARRENQTHVRDTLDYLQHAIALTRSEDAMRVIAGLMALTGRRPIEVASTGSLSKLVGAGGDYCVVFEGQAKTKGRTGTMHDIPFAIPVLCAPFIALDAWQHLRNSARGRQIATMAPRIFNKRLGTTLGYIVGVEFSRYLRGGRSRAQPKDLRGIYAEICNQIYNGDGLIGRRIMDNGLYYSRILGHGAHSGQISDAYKAFVLDDLPATPDPRPLPNLTKRPRPPSSLHGLSTLGLPRKSRKRSSA
ncbi:MAG: protelomerase family protein [Proteobacteria bacterium]|nr:protelomerase family protein [Pseudomonadota bacterium]